MKGIGQVWFLFLKTILFSKIRRTRKTGRTSLVSRFFFFFFFENKKNTKTLNFREQNFFSEKIIRVYLVPIFENCS